MPLRRIRISALRNIAEAELPLAPGTNYLFGANGAGKTSVLEGIHLLGRGRSFRTRQVRRIVQHGGDGCAVYGELEVDGEITRLGVALRAGELEKRIDGDAVPGTAALAARLAVHVIEPGMHALIEGGPSDRRRFLDWGVFHVEHSYLDAWRSYRRALGQRNAALKARVQSSELSVWTRALIDAGERVHVFRAEYMNHLADAAKRHGSALLEQELTIEYARGWNADTSLAESLAANETRDREYGVTTVGPHRADLIVRLGGRRAQDEASRGQQKLCAAALVLAQAEIDAKRRPGRTVLLLDDPVAELDAMRLRALLNSSEAIGAQRVITALSASQLAPSPGSAVFHVEHGRVSYNAPSLGGDGSG